MTLTPEHDKVEALRAANPTAGNLAFVLLDSDQWTLSNRSVAPTIDIPVQTIVADLLGVDFAAYQEERRRALGLSRADASIAGSIHTWAAASPAPLYETPSADQGFTVFDDPAFAAAAGDDTTTFAVIDTPAAEPSAEVANPTAEVTDAEAALIAAIAQPETSEATAVPLVNAGAEPVVDLPTIFDVPDLAPIAHAIDEDADDTGADDVALAPAQPKPALIETGTYSLLDDGADEDATE